MRPLCGGTTCLFLLLTIPVVLCTKKKHSDKWKDTARFVVVFSCNSFEVFDLVKPCWPPILVRFVATAITHVFKLSEFSFSCVLGTINSVLHISQLFKNDMLRHARVFNTDKVASPARVFFNHDSFKPHILQLLKIIFFILADHLTTQNWR